MCLFNSDIAACLSQIIQLYLTKPGLDEHGPAQTDHDSGQMHMNTQTLSSAALRLTAELEAADPTLLSNPDLLASVFSGLGDCIKILDLDGHLQFMSDGGKDVMEVDDFGPLKGCPWPDFWQGEGNEAAKSAIVSARAGVAARFSGTAVTLKGRPRVWDVQVLPIRGAGGTPTHLLSISRDVTEAHLARVEVDQLSANLQNAAIREAEGMRRLFAAAPGFMCTLEGPYHVFKIVNQACYTLLGRTDLVGRTVRQALPELAGQSLFSLLDQVYESGQAFVANGEGVTLSGQSDGTPRDLFLNFVLQPILDPAGSVTGIFISGNDVTELKQTELALKRRELQLQVALDAAKMGVWDAIVSDGRILSTSEDAQASALLGPCPAKGASFEAFLGRVHPSDRVFFRRSVDQALKSGLDAQLDVEFRVLSDEMHRERWIHAVARLAVEPETTRLIGTVRDITERKEAEHRNQLLNGELQHRIKNTFAMVSAIATQTLKGDAILEQRDTFNARLHTLAHAHDLLMGREEATGTIREVVEAALAPHRGSAEQFVIDGPELPLTHRQTLSLALAIHELATNATKYGALSATSGQVSIQWDQQSRGVDGQAFTLRWEEQGGPPVQAPTRSGFGSRLITRVLAADFHGQVTLDFTPAGLICLLASRYPVQFPSQPYEAAVAAPRSA
jgi:two-component sensor histidine kinase/PAS domain-containing protein